MQKQQMERAKDIIETLADMRDENQQQMLCRFFKTGKGEYGEGDKFLGLKVPQTRAVVKEVRGEISLDEVEILLFSEWHEVRLCGFLLLVEKMKKALPGKRLSALLQKSSFDELENKLTEQAKFLANERQRIVDFYLKNARQANNWDLVDLSCEYIIGLWLLHPRADGTMPDRSLLDHLAESDNLWEQRMSIVSTLTLIRARQFDDTIRIASKLLLHHHDLIHKAVGWMLREVGKRDVDVLRGFLAEYATAMPRTMLRYAIEKMDEEERKYWLGRA